MSQETRCQSLFSPKLVWLQSLIFFKLRQISDFTKLAQLGKEIWSETVFLFSNLATSLPIQISKLKQVSCFFCYIPNEIIQNIHQQDHKTWDIIDSSYGTVCDVTLYIFFSIVLFPTFDLRKPGDIVGCKVCISITYRFGLKELSQMIKSSG